MAVAHVGKTGQCPCLFGSRRRFVLARHTLSDYLAFKTTKVRLTLSSYSILSKIKRLLKFFGVTNIRRKSCQVSIPVKIYNSLDKVNSELSMLAVNSTLLEIEFQSFESQGTLQMYQAG